MDHPLLFILLVVALFLTIEQHALPLHGPRMRCSYEQKGEIVNFENGQRKEFSATFYYLVNPDESCCPAGTETPWFNDEVTCNLKGKLMLMWDKWVEHKFGSKRFRSVPEQSDAERGSIEWWVDKLARQ
jgi:hypothetical protein